MPPRVFYTATLIGSLLWCAVLVTIGYLLGVHYMLAVTFIEQYTLPAIVVLVALVAGYLWLHQRLSHLGQGKMRRASQAITQPRTPPTH